MSQLPRTSVPKFLRLSRLVTFIVSAAVALSGGCLIALGGTKVWNSELIVGIGSTLVSLGLVTLLSEFFLRSVYTFDLVRLVELRDHVLEVGFEEAAFEADVRWTDFYADVPKIIAILPNPSGWIAREWNILLAAAKSRPVSAVIYLPDADSSDLMTFGAKLFDTEVDEYRSQIVSAEAKLRTNWESNALHPKSELSVYRLTEPAPYTLVMAGERTSFILHSVGEHPSTNNLAIRFSPDGESSVKAWIEGLIGQLERKNYDLYFEKKGPPKLSAASSHSIGDPQ